ncbi:SpoIIE family protein phosphatase [Streptomyces sp. ISL-1]|uniref:SpoIIE family protein phosphatase n=1 Tax=Streptomyces sp. ISL-1 TaxID=2817657 RepID=UPI001BE6C3D8|nr:SpoIIE family protein phosphatase [Streptomyces sp. ISL-1]MBT2388619.1 SpoIIE family protein phosphatase [Streptomyces sp. ISL-1]
MDTPVTTFSEGPEDPFAVRRAALMVLDDRGRVVGWSERAEALLGHPPEEALGRPAVDFLVDPRDQDVVMDAVAACVRDRGWFGVVPVRHREGHRVELGCRARMIVKGDSPREWFLVGAPAEEVIEWETDRSVLDGLFRRSPIGLVVHARDLTILRVNRAIARFSQLPVEQHRGLTTSDFLIQQDTDTVERQLREVLKTGRSSVFAEQPCRTRQDPSREMFVSVSAFRMEDPSGRILGVTQTVEDVTERHQARRRLALLNEASARIGTTLGVAETARELAEVAVPELADCVSVDLLEPVTRGEEPTQETFETVRRTAVRSILPDTAEVMFPVGHTIHVPPGTLQARCLAERRPLLEAQLKDGPTGWLSMDPERAERALSLGVHSLMVVPLVARGLVLGLLSLWRSQRVTPFEEDDLTLAEEFASRAAVCIDNARRYTQEHETALTLQHSLLPHDVPRHPAVEVAHRYLPADTATGVGGDWFDVIPLSGVRIALVVGDVVGRGIHAAATMGRLRTAVHTLANLDLTPDEVLSHLDDLVDRLADEQESTDERSPQIIGATCLYAVYDPVSRHCALARAGHPPPAVVTPAGDVHLLELPPGPPLGLGGLPFETAELELPEGSLLTLYTDGLIQGLKRDVDESLADLCGALTSPARSLEETCEAVEAALLRDRSTDDVADDVALLIARTRVLAAEKVATWELPLSATAPAQARTLTESQLAEWGLEEMDFTTELIVSELVTNAYRYGDGPITLRLIRDGHLICEVSDTSSTSPHLRRARTTEEGGRGLFLVAQLTERWGTRYTRDGKTIWTEQPLSSTSAS